MEVKKILSAREKTHGQFQETAFVTQGIKDALASLGTSDKLSPVQSEALSMIASKMARIVSGDPNFADHWADIAGYADLAREQLAEEQPKPK